MVCLTVEYTYIYIYIYIYVFLVCVYALSYFFNALCYVLLRNFLSNAKSWAPWARPWALNAKSWAPWAPWGLGPLTRNLKPSQAKPSQAKPSQAKPSRAQAGPKPSRAQAGPKPSRAQAGPKPAQAGPSRPKPSPVRPDFDLKCWQPGCSPINMLVIFPASCSVRLGCA